MDQTLPNLSTHRNVRPHHRAWLSVLLIGLAIYVVAIVELFTTTNPRLFPTVMLLGNFLTPLVFVTFVYERRQHSIVTLPLLLIGFVVGGVLGLLIAGPAEALLLPRDQQTISLTTAFTAGAIEELSKLVAVLLVARRWRHNNEMDGIVLGAAGGMGFAALESSGYAFAAFVTLSGHSSQLALTEALPLAESLLRGILAPLGHGVWTALLVSALFRERDARPLGALPRVLGAYLLVVVLHGVWDSGSALVTSLGIASLPLRLGLALLAQPLVGAVGLVVLWRRWRQAVAARP